MHKMVKTYNICVIMNLNQKYVLKLLFLQSTAYTFTGIYMQLLPFARTRITTWSIKSSVPNFLCSKYFVMPRTVCFEHMIYSLQ